MPTTLRSSPGRDWKVDYVDLYWKRNRGWPWPEDSLGLTPMYGEDGWCKTCAIPNRPQSGSLVLQRKGLTDGQGAWTPHWRYDAICLEVGLADRVSTNFDVELRDVEWSATSPASAMQIVAHSAGESWFDADALRKASVERYGTDGRNCRECGRWKWMPLVFGLLPELTIVGDLGSADVIASPEWFGDGRKAFRQLLVRRELAELIAGSSPKDFRAQSVALGEKRSS